MHNSKSVASASARLYTQCPSACDVRKTQIDNYSDAPLVRRRGRFTDLASDSDEEDGSPSQIGFITMEPARAVSSDRCAVYVQEETETDGRKRARLSHATTEGAVIDVPDQSLGARLTPEEKFLIILEFETNQNTGSDTVTCKSTDGRVEKPDANDGASCGIPREPTNKITQRLKQLPICSTKCPRDRRRSARGSNASRTQATTVVSCQRPFDVGTCRGFSHRTSVGLVVQSDKSKSRSKFVCSRMQCQQMKQ